MSLRLRLLLLVLLANVPLLGLMLYIAGEIRRSEVSSAETEMQGLARIAESRLGIILGASEGLLYALSEVPALARGDADACARLYENLRRRSRHITSLVVTDETGAGRCDSAGARSTLFIGDREYFARARETRRLAVGAPVISRLSGKPVVPLAFPLADAQGNFRGVLASGVDLNLFAETFVGTLADRDLIFNIWDAEGKILYPPMQTAGSEIRRAVVARQAPLVSVNALGPDGAASFYIITGLEKQIGARAAISLGVPMANLLAHSDRAYSQILLYFSIVFAASLAAALALAEFTVGRKVVALSAAAERLASGDLAARTGLRHGGDELGRLARSFDAMGDNLQVRALELRRAHEMARVAHIVTGPGGEFVSWSDTLPAILGTEGGNVPRSTRAWLERIHPADQGAFRESALRAATTKARQDIEYRLRRDDGEWVHIRQSMESLDERAAGDGALRWFSTLQDVSARKEAERRIRDQLEHLSLLDEITRSTGERLDLKSIFQIVLSRLEDSLPVDFAFVCLHDPAAGALRVSAMGARSGALARELALEEQAVIEIDANGLARCVRGELVHEPDIGETDHPFQRRLASGGLGSLVLAPLKSESRVFGVLAVARRAAHSFTSGECEFLRQLSEHVALAAHQAQLYGSLQQAYDDLRQTQAAVMQEERLRALGQMASGIAHDINNALSPVSLYVESMLETERGLSERARGYLETIQRAVEDVAQTVARMREFYRQRERQIELAPVQLNSMVEQVVDLTRARWNDMPLSRGVVVRVVKELAPDLPQVMGVESEIREALTNLVFNAVDAMPEGGTLTLRTRVSPARGDHSMVAVEVIDTGGGMDEETRRRCLEPFFTTKGERGTGLGLAMVFGMVQRHSSEIEIDSAVGAGTTVRLFFAIPAALETEAARPAAALEVPSRLRLLLIDDDPILLKSLRDALETDGHAIVAANGGEAGIAAFRAALERGEPFAAVITDLGMPYVDGRKVASAVKERSPATPVILLTGWGQRMVAENDIPADVDRVLAKPPKLREVREALAQLCTVPQRKEKTA